MEALCEVPLDAVALPVGCDPAPLSADPVSEDASPPAAVPPIPGEVWRAIEAHPGYLVSSFGRVAHAKRELSRLWQVPGQAVAYVSIGRRNVVVHKLVTAAFLGPKPAGHRLGWRDGNHANCVVWNLQWTPLKVAPHPLRAPDRPLPELLPTTFSQGFPARLDLCPRCGTLVEQEPGFMRCRFGCGRLWPLLSVSVHVQRFYEYVAGLRAGPDFAEQMSGR